MFSILIGRFFLDQSNSRTQHLLRRLFGPSQRPPCSGVRLLGGFRFFTASCGIRMKGRSGRRTPLYNGVLSKVRLRVNVKKIKIPISITLSQKGTFDRTSFKEYEDACMLFERKNIFSKIRFRVAKFDSKTVFRCSPNV